MGLLDIFRAAPDFTTLDFDSVSARLDDIVQGAFPNIQNNPNKMTAWKLPRGAVAFILDVLSKRINNAALQSRITTATLLPALLGLFKLINYNPPGRSAATVDLTFSLRQVNSRNVQIPLNWPARTDGANAVKFRTVELATIVAGQLTVVVTGKNSDVQRDFFDSSGRKGQRFVLTYSPYIEGSLSVSATNGIFTPAVKNSFFDAGSTDRVFTITIDDKERAIVTFGDGISGAIPVGQIAFSYETGGGEDGNVPATLIKNTDPGITDINGTPVACDVINLEDAGGGSNRPTLAMLKRLGPLTQTVSDVTVKRTDFEIRAMNVSGVSRALAITSNQSAGIPENTTYVYLVPAGAGVASTLLRNTVKALFKKVDGFPDPPYPTNNTHLVEVFSANYRTVDWQVILYLREGALPAVVRAAMQKAFADFFALTISSSDPTLDGAPNPNVDFGGNFKDTDDVIDGRLAWSDMEDAARDVPGVRRIEAIGGFLVNDVQNDVVLLPSEFPRPGNLVIIDGSTGNPL